MLLHKRGATSFEELVTVTKTDGSHNTFFEQTMGDGGVLRDTTQPDYRNAAQELGFVATDNEYELLLRDASRFNRLGQLRQRFAHLLIHYDIADEPKLLAALTHKKWGEYVARRLGRPNDSMEVNEKVLEDLQYILARAGQTLEHFNMPVPQGLYIPMNTNTELQRETWYERDVERTKADTRRSHMYPKQRGAFDEIAIVWTQKSQVHSSLMAPEVVAQLFCMRRSRLCSG